MNSEFWHSCFSWATGQSVWGRNWQVHNQRPHQTGILASSQVVELINPSVCLCMTMSDIGGMVAAYFRSLFAPMIRLLHITSHCCYDLVHAYILNSCAIDLPAVLTYLDKRSLVQRPLPMVSKGKTVKVQANLWLGIINPSRMTMLLGISMF